MSRPTCLVIGGRGFVGSAIAAHAAERGMRVTTVGRSDYRDIVGQRFDLVLFSAGNARRYLAERDPAADLDANVGAVYRAIADFSCERFVLVSTVDVYADPSCIDNTRESAAIDPKSLATYGFHKRLAELVTMRRAPGWLIVRLGQMVGPGLSKGPVFDALKGEPLRVSPASRYPFLRTSTVAVLTFALLDGGAREALFNVCGDESVALEDVLPKLPDALPNAPVETYRVDVSALASRVPVPSTADELRRFLVSQCS